MANLKLKKILITGAGGFIGSHLTESLLADGYKVKALIRYTSNKNLGWLNNIKNLKIWKLIGDITSFESVKTQ